MLNIIKNKKSFKNSQFFLLHVKKNKLEVKNLRMFSYTYWKLDDDAVFRISSSKPGASIFV